MKVSKKKAAKKTTKKKKQVTKKKVTKKATKKASDKAKIIRAEIPNYDDDSSIENAPIKADVEISNSQGAVKQGRPYKCDPMDVSLEQVKLAIHADLTLEQMAKMIPPQPLSVDGFKALLDKLPGIKSLVNDALKKRGKRQLTHHPEDVDPEHVAQLAGFGLKIDQIASVVSPKGMSRSTFQRLCRDNQDIKMALERGKAMAGSEVAQSLFRRATEGVTIPETKVFQYEGEIVTHDMIKHFPPDVTAQIFYLKTQLGWKENIDINLNSEGPLAIMAKNLEKMSPEERRDRLATLKLIKQPKPEFKGTRPTQ